MPYRFGRASLPVQPGPLRNSAKVGFPSLNSGPKIIGLIFSVVADKALLPISQPNKDSSQDLRPDLGHPILWHLRTKALKILRILAHLSGPCAGESEVEEWLRSGIPTWDFPKIRCPNVDLK